MERVYLSSTVELIAGEDGRVRALRLAETEYLPDGSRGPKAGTEREIPADLVLLALGFTGNESDELVSQLTCSCEPRGTVARDDHYMTSVRGVFACGDSGRGASLVVWAIAEGRACAAEVEKHLTGSTRLPAPVRPSTRAIDLR